MVRTRQESPQVQFIPLSRQDFTNAQGCYARAHIQQAHRDVDLFQHVAVPEAGAPTRSRTVL